MEFFSFGKCALHYLIKVIIDVLHGFVKARLSVFHMFCRNISTFPIFLRKIDARVSFRADATKNRSSQSRRIQGAVVVYQT